MSPAIGSFRVECPSCETGFDVDPEKVPGDGLHAICSSCWRTFHVASPVSVGGTGPVDSWTGFDTLGEPSADAGGEHESGSAGGVPTAGPAREVAPADPSPAAFEDLSSFVSDLSLKEEEGAPGPDESGPTLSSGAGAFGRRDPHDRARRLARVLVSDMMAYHPDRYAASMAAGTLKEDFEAEVERSWKDYVDQVGLELAESTPYFTDALNEILAEGDTVY